MLTGREEHLATEPIALQVSSGFRQRTLKRRLLLMAGLAVLVLLLSPHSPRDQVAIDGGNISQGYRAELSIPLNKNNVLLRTDSPG